MGDEKLLSKAAAKHADLSFSSWRVYRVRGTAPEPDGRDEVSGTPWWWASTIDEWSRTRRRLTTVSGLPPCASCIDGSQPCDLHKQAAV